MGATPELTTVRFYPKGNPRYRLIALWYFVTLLVAWTILGHTYLGFEQSWTTPIVAVATAFALQLLLDWVDARAKNRPIRFLGGIGAFLSFLPPAIIPGLACAMLLYPNDRLMPIVFASGLSICSKVMFRAPVGNGRWQHIFNPSNLGIAATLVLFPWVGFAPPYHLTTNLTGIWHWVIPGIILVSGIIIHAFFTGRLPLCLAWVGGFAVQGVIRSFIAGTPAYWHVPLVPMTSAAFVVFTLYMIPDPATTPINPWRQVIFGLGTAAIYGVLQLNHIVFGLFFALVLASAIRALGLYSLAGLRAFGVIGEKSVRKEPVNIERSLTIAAAPVTN